jgi:hypothetical protein
VTDRRNQRPLLSAPRETGSLLIFCRNFLGISRENFVVVCVFMNYNEGNQANLKTRINVGEDPIAFNQEANNNESITKISFFSQFLGKSDTNQSWPKSYILFHSENTYSR